MKEMLTNKILSRLPDAEFARLVPLLEPVSLAAGERLTQSGTPTPFIFFPENSIISCHAEMQDGKSTEVGMIGFDGVAGLPALLSTHPSTHTLNVSVGGSALRVRREDFEREMESGDGLRRSLLVYAGDYLAQVSQRVACAILHRMEQRLAVWLLLLSDRLDTDVVEMTQERIAQHLGVRRAGVTELAGHLQRQGVISYTRGSLRLVNRPALGAIACECYGALTAAQQKSAYM